MSNKTYPVLCGGTFFTLILEARIPRTSKRSHYAGELDGLSQPETLAGLGKVVYPEYDPPRNKRTFSTNASDYRSCDNNGTNLSFLFEQTVNVFDNRIKNNYPSALMAMVNFVDRFLEVGTSTTKEVWLLKALLELIEADRSIDDAQIFYIGQSGQGITKATLRSINDFCLQSFLLGVWHFVIVNRQDNQVGKATFDVLCPPKGRAERKYEGKLGNSITRAINVSLIAAVGDAAHGTLTARGEEAELAASPVEKFIMPDVYTYLRNAENKYSTIKTLLYNDQPKPFYDFYVCNEIWCGTMNSRDARHPQNGCRIEGATVATIAQHAKFAIISGTGGLGKSMMMRHLMLNALANFDDLKLFPVFVQLKDYDETVSTLFDYMYSKIRIFDRSLTSDQFEQLLVNGSCLLLFDGLDEIGAGCAKKFERELEALTDNYSNNVFILSTRPFQSFVSYGRFSLFRLIPFNKKQAMQLIVRLEFRPDEPAIKEKFLTVLEKTLFRTHRSFTENPLLLTIMLLTFEQFAEVPSKMHIFYREAFEVLAKRHDASKGAYKRALKTGLSVDAFADYFAELCFRSYNDEKFELTAEEFTEYFKALKVKATANDQKTTASDFLEDLCSNLCLMYFEGDRYHFTHRSFQEYFCALFFSKQKDRVIAKLGDFFEKHQQRMYGDGTFDMLYDMITEKVEEFIFIPFLTALFDKCNRADGYWTFLEEMYPRITYSSERVFHFRRSRVLEPRSFIFSKALEKGGFKEDAISLTNLTYYESLEVERLTRIRQEAIFSRHGEEIDIEEKEEDAGYICRFDVAEIRQHPEEYDELLDELSDDKFVFKIQYHAAQRYLKELEAKQKTENDSLLDLL